MPCFRRLIWTLAALLTCFAAEVQLSAALVPSTQQPSFSAQEIERGYRQGRVLVKRRALASVAGVDQEAAFARAEARAGVKGRRSFRRLTRQQVLEVESVASIPEAIARLRESGLYEFVEPDYIRGVQAVPNDSRYAEQWSLNNSGQSGGTPDADIDAPEAWDTTTDASAVTVAVIDSGLRVTHEDIVDNLWSNRGEIAGNGRDDDGNGYIDDVNGINAVVSRSSVAAGNPADDNGHGTHVAGTIGAVGNNGVGVAGVAWKVRIMALKFLGTDGRGSVSDAAECIDYSIAQGAQVINASYGALSTGESPSQTEVAAIQRARDAGIIFVAASGNDGLNLDVARTFPATYPVDNIIAVGNSTRLEDVATSSNVGSGAVDLFAPGSEILSLASTSDSAYIQRTGTSMAAPHVAGAAALLRARFPGETYRQTINRLLRSVDPIPKYVGKVATGGRLNLQRALASTETRPFNDHFGERARLQGELIQVRSASQGATIEASEPAHAGGGGATLWWTWTASTSSTVNIDTQGSGFDTVLAVYRGTSLSELSLVEANDNRANGTETSSVTFSAQAGTSYQIAVGGKGTAAGLVLLNLGSIPANDNFVNAAVLTQQNPIVTATNSKASTQSGEPAHAGLPARRSLWYRWTAPSSARYHATAGSAQLSPIVAVYTGDSLGALTAVASDVSPLPDAETKSAIASFDAVAGRTYSIAVDSASVGSIELNGEFTFTISDAAWMARTENSVTSSAVVGGNGTLYIGSNDSSFYAIDTGTGLVRWKYTISPTAIIDTGVAAVDPNGVVYFGASNGSLYALEDRGDSASVKWVTPIGGPIANAPAIGSDGTLYIRADRGSSTGNAQAQLVALAPETGAVLWRYDMGTEASYAPASIGADGTIYVAGGDSALHAVTPAGARRWRFLADNQIYTSPSLDVSGNLYIASLSGTVYSLTSQGAQRWRVSAGGFVTSSLALANGTAYFASYDKRLYALDMATGQTRWTYFIGEEVRASSPAVAEDGSIFIGAYDRRVHHVNGDGTLRRTYAASNWFRSSPLLAGGRLYIGSNDGRVYAFDVGLRAASGSDAPWPQHRHNVRRTGRAVNGLDEPAGLGDNHGTGRLVNLSVRTVAASGERSLITGFVVAGPAGASPKQLLVRGIGPGLTQFGVAGVLADPALVLADGGGLTIAVNDNWEGSATVSSTGARVGAFALADQTSRDAALVTSLGSGQFTARISGSSGASGVALAEVYDATVAAGTGAGLRLINMSVRAVAGSGAEVLIAGFVVADGPRRVLIRAVGPGLSAFGVGGVLADPQLDLYRDQTRIDGNGDWAGNPLVTQAGQRVGAFALAPGSKDAAMVVLLSPGAYSAQAKGADGAEGVALVEVYEIR
jgi:subtilisin family serine protease/outer membrane protein assembly factor BamB